MSERDELIEDIVDGHDQGFFPRAEIIADHLIARGYRKMTVTPEQIGDAAAEIAQSDGHVLNMLEWPSREMYRANACAAARAFGLEVTE